MLSDVRRRKQLAIGGLFALLFLGVLVTLFAVLLRSAPSCTDGVLNQEEEGVDCGGPCPLLCAVREAQPLSLLGKVHVFYAGSEGASILAKIENPNFELAAREFDYTFTLYGRDGAALGTRRGTSFIYAREVKYLLLPNTGIPAPDIGEVEVTFRAPEWVPKEEFPAPRLVVQNFTTRIGREGVEVAGILRNNDAVIFPRVQALSLLYGQFGQPTGASFVELRDLAPSEARPFTILHPPVPHLDPEKTEVVVSALRQ